MEGMDLIAEEVIIAKTAITDSWIQILPKVSVYAVQIISVLTKAFRTSQRIKESYLKLYQYLG
jgi:hypothetical protein